MNIKQSLVLLIAFLIPISQALGKSSDPFFSSNCFITPYVPQKLAHFEPLYKGNNLRRKAGEYHLASGDFIRVFGRVLDKNCLPVSGALITAWHADSNGLFKKKFLEDTEEDEGADKFFTGVGQTYTDNLGYYFFLTIMPGTQETTRAPNISFEVYHPDFLLLQTVMFFPDKVSFYLDTDSLLKEIRHPEYLTALMMQSKKMDINSEKNLETDYRFDFVFSGESPYTRY